jgi:hypothetical protein
MHLGFMEVVVDLINGATDPRAAANGMTRYYTGCPGDRR